MWVTNGVAQPFLNTRRSKDRLRILNGCNVRFLELQFRAGQPNLRIGKDSWPYPQPLDESMMILTLGSRAEFIIVFVDAPEGVFLNNVPVQTNGRKPEVLLDRSSRTEVVGTPTLGTVERWIYE